MSMDLATIGIEFDTSGLDKGKEALKKTGDEANKTADTAEKTGASFKQMSLAVAAGNAIWSAAEMAMNGVRKSLGMIEEVTKLAARYETMGVVMRIAGNNAGYTSEKMEELSKKLQDSGISMLQSRDAMTQLATANIDLSKASEIGRAAQDLAVVANVNSSEAMQRMIHGIKANQVEVLRTLGLNVDFEASYKTLAATLGKNSDALTENEKMQARVNATLQGSKMYAGIYEESMGTAGKAMKSLERYVENLKVKVGDTFLPAFTDGVFAVMDALKQLNKTMDDAKESGWIEEISQFFADVLVTGFQTIAVVGANVAFVLKSVGREIGGIVAQFAAMGEAGGIFTKEGRAAWEAVGKEVIADGEKARKDLDEFEAKVMNPAKRDSKKVDEQARIDAGAAMRADIERQQAETASATALQPHLKALDEKIALMKEELGTTQRLTDAEKTRTKILAEIGPKLTAKGRGQLDAKVEVAKTLELQKAWRDVGAAIRDAADAQKEYLDTLVRGWNRELDGMGKGGIARRTSQGQSDIEDKYAKQLQDLDRERQKLTMTGQFGAPEREKYDAQVAVVKNFREQALAEYKKYDDERQRIEGDWQKGAEEGLNNYRDTVRNTYASMSTMVSNAFKGMEDALVNFVKTGKLDFSSLVDSMITDLIRLQVQKQIMAPLMGNDWSGVIGKVGSLFAGGGDGGAATTQDSGDYGFNSPSGNRAEGGQVLGGTPYLVGENGPEIVVPSGNGTVLPNKSLGGGSNVTVNIVESPGNGGQVQNSKENGVDVITIMVEKVKSAIASDIARGSGPVPQALSSSYGLNRAASSY